MTRVRFIIAALTIAAAAACADRATSPTPPPPPLPPPPPVPAGSAIVSLTTPNSDDGAVAVTLRGPGISNLATASSGYIFYSRLASDSVARVIVIGNVAAGPIFTFKLASGAGVSAYQVVIDQIATRGDALRTSHASYALGITAAP